MSKIEKLSISLHEHEVRRSMTTSPTDQLLSPCSKQLLRQKNKLPIENVFSMEYINKYDLASCLTRLPFPNTEKKFILGTSSASRKLILDKLGWNYIQMSPDIDEKAIRSSDPMELPLLIAKAKADALYDRLKSENSPENYIILTSDQIVLYKSEIREKPTGAEEAYTFLSSYSNDDVSTISAIVITEYPSKQQKSGVDIATVYWNEISDEVINKVINKGEIYNSAGGFRIEDEDLNPLIRYMEGSYDSIMGLPVSLTVELIEDVINIF